MEAGLCEGRVIHPSNAWMRYPVRVGSVLHIIACLCFFWCVVRRLSKIPARIEAQHIVSYDAHMLKIRGSECLLEMMALTGYVAATRRVNTSSIV